MPEDTDQPTLAVQAHEWRKREVQAIGAAISTRSWPGVELAYNVLRDKMDRAGCWNAPKEAPKPASEDGATGGGDGEPWHKGAPVTPSTVIMLGSTTTGGDLLEQAARYRHVKRGTVYEVVGEAELQTATGALVDGSVLVVYRGDDGKLWAREEGEFHDGRFVALSPARDGAGS